MDTQLKDIPNSYPDSSGRLKVTWTCWVPLGNTSLTLAVSLVQYYEKAENLISQKGGLDASSHFNCAENTLCQFLCLMVNNQLVNKQAYAGISLHHGQRANKSPTHPHPNSPHLPAETAEKQEVGAYADTASPIERL